MSDFYYEQVGKDGDIISVVVSGQLDASNCEYLLDCVAGRIEDGHKKLILDCTDLTHITSVGLGILMRVHSRMKKQGGDVKLAGVKGTVAQVAALVKLDRVLHMYRTVGEAVAAHGG